MWYHPKLKRSNSKPWTRSKDDRTNIETFSKASFLLQMWSTRPFPRPNWLILLWNCDQHLPTTGLHMPRAVGSLSPIRARRTSPIRSGWAKRSNEDAGLIYWYFVDQRWLYSLYGRILLINVQYFAGTNDYVHDDEYNTMVMWQGCVCINKYIWIYDYTWSYNIIHVRGC